MEEPKKVSAPIRMDAELLEKVKMAGKKTGLAQADVMRLCLAIGLEDLKRVDYDLAKVIAEAASHQRESIAPGKLSISTPASGAAQIEQKHKRRGKRA